MWDVHISKAAGKIPLKKHDLNCNILNFLVFQNATNSF